MADGDAKGGGGPSGGDGGGERKRRRRRRRGGRGKGRPPEGGASDERRARGDGDDDGGERSGRGRRRRGRGRGRGSGGDRGGRRDDRRGARRDESRGRRAATEDEFFTPDVPEIEDAPGTAAPPATAAVDDGWTDDDATAAPPSPPADDADAPAAEVTLAADLPADAAGDPDPVTAWLEDAEADADAGDPADTVANVAGIKFAPAGKIYLYDAGDASYEPGETVIVDADRGVRAGTVAIAPARRAHRGKPLQRILRRPDPADLRRLERGDARAAEALATARALARTSKLPIKVFRVEPSHAGKKMLVYFTCEERIEYRNLARDLSRELGCRVDMRQTGVRDEAKAVGGIGSCGRELCCTTWLPEFVPVSIKMAKDQGLVLNPTKVSGQCGRLKCCLVYEQATYAELRKGLPKLGKRVITDAGEGRVVEVDVLHQRVRVSLGPGESQVFPGHEVQPMFPSQKPNPPRPKGGASRKKRSRRRGPRSENEGSPTSES